MKYRQNVKIMCLFTLLMFIVCIPAVLSRSRNDYMTDEISLFPVEADAFNASAAKEYNLWERIKIPQKTTTVMVLDTNEFEQMSISDEAAKELIHSMEEQLQKIQECQGLPELKFSEISKGHVMTDLYMDTVNPKYVDILGVRSIYAEYEDFAVNACMDTRTFALLDVVIRAKTEDFIYPSDVTPDGFLEYLSFFSDIEEENEEQFLAYGEYGPREMHLYLGSVNKITGERILYRFFQ